MASLPCSQSTVAVNHLSRGYERLTQLRALLLSSSPDKLSSTAQTISFLDNALTCVAAALSELQTRPQFRSNSANVEGSKNGTNPNKRRKIQSWTIVTSVPHFDGHQWRKYGQKNIDGAEFPRSYFKCTYSNGQGCPATKTVQKKEDDDKACVAGANPPIYEVRYRMQHTCKVKEADDFPVLMNSSEVINRSNTSSPNWSHELSATAGREASPEQLSQTTLPLQVSDMIDDNSLMEEVHLMESMLHSTSTEPRGQENGGAGSSSNLWSPLDELDFDWEWLMS